MKENRIIIFSIVIVFLVLAYLAGLFLGKFNSKDDQYYKVESLNDSQIRTMVQYGFIKVSPEIVREATEYDQPTGIIVSDPGRHSYRVYIGRTIAKQNDFGKVFLSRLNN